MKSKFDNYIKTLRITNIETKNLIDFKKINDDYYKKIDNINKLNYIISDSKKNIKSNIFHLFNEDRNSFSILPSFFGLKNHSYIVINNEIKKVQDIISNPNDVYTFLDEIGFIENILNKNIQNFNSYYYGFSIGIDSNARKNRNGKNQEIEIREILKKFVSKYEFLVLEEQQNNINDDFSNKIFDFVITNKKNNMKVLIESSFYNAGGSKISETARSYYDIFKKIEEYKQFKFIWVADGQGMKTIQQIIKNYIELGYITNTNNLINVLEFMLFNEND